MWDQAKAPVALSGALVAAAFFLLLDAAICSAQRGSPLGASVLQMSPAFVGLGVFVALSFFPSVRTSYPLVFHQGVPSLLLPLLLLGIHIATTVASLLSFQVPKELRDDGRVLFWFAPVGATMLLAAASVARMMRVNDSQAFSDE